MLNFLFLWEKSSHEYTKCIDILLESDGALIGTMLVDGQGASMTIDLQIGNSDQEKVAVISHERSGTHFLMNSLAANFNYNSNPWWNRDFELGINFHSPASILEHIQQAHDIPIKNILKSHHQIGFFKDIMEYFSAESKIFYIHRDPVAALRSNWKLICHFRLQGWDEGPETETLSEFLRTPPSGNMLRYQKFQVPSMVHRWYAHVSA